MVTVSKIVLASLACFVKISLLSNLFTMTRTVKRVALYVFSKLMQQFSNVQKHKLVVVFGIAHFDIFLHFSHLSTLIKVDRRDI